MLKILLLAALLVAGLAYAKEERAFHRAGVVGTCARVQAPRTDEGEWWSCREGFLTGFPSLIKDGCDRKGMLEAREVWRCPAPLGFTPGSI